MSILNYIKTKKDFSFEVLISTLKKQHDIIQFEQRSPVLCFMWMEGFSTRGVDVSMDEVNWIELRNTILSNDVDYHLTELLATDICSLFEGDLFKFNENFDEENDSVDKEYLKANLPLFEEEFITNQFQEDVGTLGYMIAANESAFGIWGPKRDVQLGPNFYGKMNDKSQSEKAEIVFKTILNVNYAYPDYPYGNVLSTGKGSEMIKLKLISNSGDYMIGKNDFIVFQKNETDNIMLSNNTFNSILPDSWKLIDEYNVVAPQLSDEEFEQLKLRADSLNEEERFETLMKERGED